MTMINSTRYSDAEIDTYHGGREAYIARCEEELIAAIADRREPTQPVEQWLLDATGMSQREAAALELRARRNRIACIRAAIAANR